MNKFCSGQKYYYSAILMLMLNNVAPTYLSMAGNSCSYVFYGLYQVGPAVFFTFDADMRNKKSVTTIVKLDDGFCNGFRLRLANNTAFKVRHKVGQPAYVGNQHGLFKIIGEGRDATLFS